MPGCAAPPSPEKPFAQMVSGSSCLNSVKESLELCEKNKGPVADLITADNFHFYSAFAHDSVDPRQAKLFAEKSLTLHQSLDNKFGIAEASIPLFYMALSSGDLESASRWNNTGIVIRKELGDKDGLAYHLTIGAMIPLSRHDYKSTKRMLAAAVEVCKEARNEFALGRALGYFGLTCLFEDNMGQAIDYFSQLVTLAHHKSNGLLKTLGIYYLVLFFSIQRRFPAALKLHGAI